MTTVAFDGRTIAADTLSTIGGVCRGSVTKIHKLHDGSVVGFAGELQIALDVLAWFEAGEPPDAKPRLNSDADFLALRVWPAPLLAPATGPLVFMYEDRLQRIPVLGQAFWAIGSGSTLALAAMFCGKTAAEAVLVAAHFDRNTNNEVQTLAL